MARKRLIVEAEVRALARGSELVIGEDVIVTPSALDAAFERGIRVVRAEKPGETPAAPLAAPSSLWQRMHQGDGTYVVVVKNGHATVARLTDQGPILFGAE